MKMSAGIRERWGQEGAGGGRTVCLERGSRRSSRTVELIPQSGRGSEGFYLLNK